MDAPERSVTPAEAAELQRLRWRAYGPDADIARDPAAQARLSELEAAIGQRVLALPGGREADSTRKTTRGGADYPTFAEDEGAPTHSEPAPAPPEEADRDLEGSAVARKPWWRHPVTWVVSGFLLVAIVGMIATLPALLPGAPDHTLAIRSEGEDIPREDRQELNTHGMVSYLGLVAEELRLYDDFRGVNVWSAPTEFGTTCLFLTTRSQGMWAVACAPPETAPQVEVNLYSSELVHRDEQDPWRGMPWGSLIRFRLQGDDVLVWQYPAPAA